ncbi:unnamed protein product [Peniophora sp. CBMAI 1063]|nr:unnamed protein product [Peniophora sp. CBMAI 1063]
MIGLIDTHTVPRGSPSGSEKRGLGSEAARARARLSSLSSSVSLSSSPAHDKPGRDGANGRRPRVAIAPSRRVGATVVLARSRALCPGLRGLEKTGEHQDRVPAGTSPSTDVHERRGRRGVPASVGGPLCRVLGGVEECRTGALRREGVGGASGQAVEGGAHSEASST